MTKKEFSDKMAEKAGLTKADAQKAYDAFLEVTSDYLKSGERVSFLGFGKRPSELQLRITLAD